MRSNVNVYAIADDAIYVAFNGSEDLCYVYTNNSVGEYNLKIMKELAIKGCGLNSFIMKYVRKDYERIIKR